MKDFMKVSPLKILERSSQKALGRGNLGVLMARAGMGKTACLIHIAFDKLFRDEKLVHVSLEDVPEKVTSYYNVVFYDLVKAFSMDDEHEIRMLLERNRMILAYLNQSFEIRRLRENLKNLVEKIDFVLIRLLWMALISKRQKGRDLKVLKRSQPNSRWRYGFQRSPTGTLPMSMKGGSPIHVTSWTTFSISLFSYSPPNQASS